MRTVVVSTNHGSATLTMIVEISPTNETAVSGTLYYTVKNSSITTKDLYLILTFVGVTQLITALAYDRFLDATADHRIKTRKN